MQKILFILLPSFFLIILVSSVSVASPIYISQYSRTEYPAAYSYENANISVETDGVSNYIVTGAIDGQAVVNITKTIEITSGTYAGWSYSVQKYNLSGYQGNIYIIKNSDRFYGTFTGNIHGVMKYDNGILQVYITSINGNQASGIINLRLQDKNQGSIINTNTTLAIRNDPSLTTFTGYFNGTATSTNGISIFINYNGVTDVIINRQLQTDIGNAELFLYGSSNGFRIGAYYGAIFAARNASFGALTGEVEHVLQSNSTPVPIMESWWLLPGVLAGIGIFARRRKE